MPGWLRVIADHQPVTFTVDAVRSLTQGDAARQQQAAERLRYQPNALARGLLSGRSFTVGLITTDSFGRFSIPVVQGAEEPFRPGERVRILSGRGATRVTH